MWTGKFSRYLLVLLCALSSNVAWGQEKSLRLYFNEYNDQANATPTLSFGGDVPAGVTITASGFTWALSYKLTLLNEEECKDRIVVKKNK
jgi:hypothetical protein